MKSLLLLSYFLIGFYGCAAIKPVLRTVEDIATSLCESVAAKHTDRLQALSPADWCAIHSHLEPFIDAVLSVQRAAGLAQVP